MRDSSTASTRPIHVASFAAGSKSFCRNPLVPACSARCTSSVPTPQALVIVDAAMGRGCIWVPRRSGRVPRTDEKRAADRLNATPMQTVEPMTCSTAIRDQASMPNAHNVVPLTTASVRSVRPASSCSATARAMNNA
jgi:hypothetical protein